MRPGSRSRIWSLLVAGAGASLVLSGCGTATDEPAAAQDHSSATSAAPEPADTETSEEPAPTTEPVTPAAGPLVRARGFSLHLPRGWVDVTDRTSTPALITGADVRADEVPPMVVVERLPQGAGTARQAATVSRTRLASAHLRSLQVQPQVDVNGTGASHVSALDPDRTVHQRVDQFVVPTDHGAYAITFRLNRWGNPDDRERLISSVLSTVAW